MNRKAEPPVSPAPPPSQNIFMRVVRFYVEGFREMTTGRVLWVIILIKLFILFFVFKLFLFPDILERDYDNDADRAQAVRNSLLDDSRHPR